MRRLKRNLWKVGSVLAGILLLLTCISVSVADAHRVTSAFAEPGTITVQATPTEDATVTALNKEQLTQQVAYQQHTWNNWLWSNAAPILSSVFSTLVVIIGVLFGFWQWRVGRKDTQTKESEDRRVSQDKELKDQQDEREKRAEERFQAAVTGLGDEKEGARIGAAILLRTFLRSGYEPFYIQTFDLAVAHLRLRNCNPDAAEPLDILSQALITVFKEAFPLARDRLKEENAQFRPQSLVARSIQLDNAYLSHADLERVWMPQASLRNANLIGVNLIGANLSEADLSGADLSLAKLCRTNLDRAKFSGTRLSGAKLGKADLSETDLRTVKLNLVDLSEANLTRANLVGVNLTGVHLAHADLAEAKLCGADLSEANLTRANLGPSIRSLGNKMSGADLSNAKFRNTDLSGAHLVSAKLNKADLYGANLSGANLRRADLIGANPEDAFSLDGANLCEVSGLTKEQLVMCKAKGAIIDEDPTTSASQSTVTPSSPS